MQRIHCTQHMRFCFCHLPNPIPLFPHSQLAQQVASSAALIRTCYVSEVAREVGVANAAAEGGVFHPDDGPGTTLHCELVDLTKTWKGIERRRGTEGWMLL